MEERKKVNTDEDSKEEEAVADSYDAKGFSWTRFIKKLYCVYKKIIFKMEKISIKIIFEPA